MGGFNGNNGFVKNGNGALAIYGNTYSNNLSGPIVVNGGLLGTVNSTAFQSISGNITVASGASFEANADYQSTTFTNSFFLSGMGGTPSGYVGNAATPDGTYNGEPTPFGALDIHGNSTLSGAITLNASSEITHGYNVATLNSPITGVGMNLELAITVGGQYPMTANGNINLGTGALTVSGVPNGAYVDLAGSNTLGGVTVLANGTAYFSSTKAIGGSGSLVTINAGGAATLNGNSLSSLLAQVATNSTGAMVLAGVSSSTALNLANYPSLSLGALAGGVFTTPSTYSGTLTPGGGNYQLGGGGGTLTVSSSLTGASTGLIVNSNSASGTILLTGTHTYGGTTAVCGGTLMATGTLAGPVVVQTGGTLSPGPATGLGTLTVNNSVNISGTLAFSINRTNAQNADLLAASSLVLGGTLTVNNIGPTPLVLGDTFQLFSVSGVFSNAQPTLNLPALPAGLAWNVNNLSVNGTLVVGQITNVVGSTNWPSLLPQELLSAYSAGYSNVTINPGTYVMNNGTGAAFNFNGWNNCTINASNTLFLVDTGYVDLVSSAVPAGFNFNDCTNVTLAGAVVRSKVYPFTQGRVTAIGTNNGVLFCDWQISAGYPATNFQWWFNAVSASNQMINLTQGDMYYSGQYGTNASGAANNAVYLGNQTWQLSFPNWLTSFSFQTNDWLVARVNSQGFAYYLSACTNCTLLDCISQCGGFGTYRENLGGGNHILSCQIQPAPVPPAGGTELPVVANAADGLHTSFTSPGMDLENFVLQGVFLDDCVTFHGGNNNVVSSSGTSVTFDGAGMFTAGDPVRIYSTNGPYFAEAICTAVEILGNGNCQLTLNQSLSIPAGAAGEDPIYNGSGYKVINCQLGNVRSRGILNKADNGLITGCTIQNAQTGIELGPEIYWGGGGYVWNVTMTNNTLVHCGSVGINLVTAGAIGNLNNIIQDNSFQNVFLGDDINFSGCGGMTIAGNLFVNPSAGNNPLYLAQSTNVVLLENFVTNDAAGVSLIAQGSGVTNLQNQYNGIFLAGIPYTLVNQSSNLVVNDPAGGGAGTQVAQQTSGGTDSEHWVLSPVGNGFCALVCVTNGLVLSVNGSTTSNAAVVLAAYTGGADQLWALAPVTNSFVAFTNQLSGLAIHAQSGASGQPLVQRPYTGATNQQWFLLSAPLGLSAALGTGVTLSWTAYTGATSYNVARATSPNGPYVTLATNLTATTYTDTGALGGGTYYYVVSSNLGTIKTPNSAAVVVLVTTFDWDSDGNSANGITDGNGTWSSTSTVWFSSTNVPDTNWPGAWATAVFGRTGAGTVTVSGTQNVSGLIFNTGYTLTGGTLVTATNGPLAVINSNSVTISSLLAGSEGLTKTGLGTLMLSNANTYAGGTTLSQATLTLGQNNALGTGPVTAASGAGNPTVWLNLNGCTLTNAIANTSGDCYVYNGSATTATLSGAIAFGSYTRIGAYNQTTYGVGNINLPGTLIGGWYDKQGAGVLALTGTNTYSNGTYITGGAVRALDGVGLTSANLQLAGGVFETTGANVVRPLGSASGQVQLTSGTSGFSAYGAPVTVALGGLGSPATLVWGSTYFNPSVLVLNYYSANTNLNVLNAINLNGASRQITVESNVANLNAPIIDSLGGAGLTNSGAGTLNLNGVNTYTGSTVVLSGTLGGTGSLTGPLTIQSGGTLSPGMGIGVFTVSNSIALGGTLLLAINQTNSPSCGQLAASTISCGGALVVTNLGPALTNHAAFKLFNAPLTGSFAVTNLPPLGLNQAWSNSLAANGTLTVVSTAAMNPTNLNFQIGNGGGTLQLTWPTNHQGWWLQTQTNALTAGLGTNWVSVAGSSQTNLVWQIINATNGAVFFRLSSP